MSPVSFSSEKSMLDQITALKSQNEILWSIIIEKGLSDLAIERGACSQSDKLVLSLAANSSSTSPNTNEAPLLTSPRPPSSIKSQRSANSIVTFNDERKKIELSTSISPTLTSPSSLSSPATTGAFSETESLSNGGDRIR